MRCRAALWGMWDARWHCRSVGCCRVAQQHGMLWDTGWDRLTVQWVHSGQAGPGSSVVAHCLLSLGRV